MGEVSCMTIPVASLAILVSVVLILLCGQTDRQNHIIWMIAILTWLPSAWVKNKTNITKLSYHIKLCTFKFLCDARCFGNSNNNLLTARVILLAFQVSSSEEFKTSYVVEVGKIHLPPRLQFRSGTHAGHTAVKVWTSVDRQWCRKIVVCWGLRCYLAVNYIIYTVQEITS